ncbi:MAG: serine/threonine protein kinase [Deltaproteobacteria bacterium]|nr:serine/threonine protein kinase [Deltaproteobacteria bacterium]
MSTRDDMAATAGEGAPEPQQTRVDPATADPPGTLSNGITDLPLVPVEDYTVHGEHARGGLGRILRAHDNHLNRPVALKQLLRGGPGAELRFLREVRITARLQHPGIVPVHAAGRFPTGEAFYTMKMVSGRSLREIISEKKALDERLALLPHVIAVAETIAYAHDRQVIHRDLKPSNVMIGPFGETVVIDWGLAKDLSDHRDDDVPVGPYRVTSEGQTMAGTVMGTPMYMPPEQARGDTVNERADVYSIGALLYDLLAGGPPYPDGDSSAVLARVLAGPPVPLEKRQPRVTKDLVAIVRTSMARNPAERYPSARELATDLKRFQAGQLVSAHEYSLLGRMARWVQRHRTLVRLAMASMLVLVLIGAASVQRIVKARHEAERQQRIAESARKEAERRSNDLTLVQARSSLDRDPTAALAWIKTYPINADNWREARGIVYDALSLGVSRHVMRGHEGTVTYLAMSPDGTKVASASHDYDVRIWDVATGECVGIFPQGAALNFLTFAPDGNTVAAGGENGGVRLFSSKTGAARRLGGKTVFHDAVFTSGGDRLIAAGADGVARMWEVSNGKETALRGHGGAILALAVAPRGDLLATASEDRSIGLWDTATGSRLAMLVGHEGAVDDLAFSAKGDLLVSASADLTVRAWDVQGRKGRILTRHQGAISQVAVSPDGTCAASASIDKTVHACEVGTGRCKVISVPGEVYTVAFAPGSRMMAYAGLDGTARLWSRGNESTQQVLRGHRSAIYHVLFSPDGSFLATGSDDKAVRIWGVQPENSRVFRGHEDDVRHVVFSPGGAVLASSGRGSTVHAWGLTAGDARAFRGHDGPVGPIHFSPDGNTLASVGFDKHVRLWDTRTGDSRAFPTGELLWDGAFSPDGTMFLAGGDNGGTWLLDVSRGITRVLRGHDGAVRSVAFSPDGKWAASGGNDGIVRLWDLATGQPTELAGHGALVERVAFSPDGNLLASASWDKTIHLWDMVSHYPRVLSGHAGHVVHLAFSPDGRQLATCSADKTVRLWSVESGESRVLSGHEEPVSHVVFSPGGTLVASASMDNTVRLWEVATGESWTLRGHEAYVTHVVFSPDGRWLASASVDKTVRLWPTAWQRLPTDPPELLGRLSELSSARSLVQKP